MKEVFVKSWFINNNMSDSERYCINECNASFTIERETEKAYRGFFDTNYGKIYAWVPKSVCMTEEEAIEEGNKINAWLQEKEDRYNRIVAWCKEQGLRVRNMMKLDTIKRIVKEAGLEIPENI